MIYYLSISFLVQSSIVIFFEVVPIISSVTTDTSNLILNILHNVILIIIIYLRNQKKIKEKIVFDQSILDYFVYLKVIFLTVFAYQVVNLIILLLENLFSLFDPNFTLISPYDSFLSNTIDILLFGVLVLSFGPIFEELLYRFITKQYSDSKIKYSYIIFSSIIFASIHLPANLLNGSIYYTIFHFFVAFSLGILLVIVYDKFGLIPAILFHSIWNGINLISQIISIGNDVRLIAIFDISTMCIMIIVSLYLIYSYIKGSWRISLEKLSLNLLQGLSIFLNTIIIVLFIFLPYLSYLLSPDLRFLYFIVLLIFYCYIIIEFENKVILE